MDKFPTVSNRVGFEVDQDTGKINYTPDGIYSESIFGPTRLLECKCAYLYSEIDINKTCPHCGVICSNDPDIRKKSHHPQFKF